MQQSIIRLELSLAAGVVLGPILMRSLCVYMTVSEIQNPEKYTTKLSAPRDTDTVVATTRTDTQPTRDRWRANIDRSISSRSSASKTLNYSGPVRACLGPCSCAHTLLFLAALCESISLPPHATHETRACRTSAQPGSVRSVPSRSQFPALCRYNAARSIHAWRVGRRSCARAAASHGDVGRKRDRVRTRLDACRLRVGSRFALGGGTERKLIGSCVTCERAIDYMTVHHHSDSGDVPSGPAGTGANYCPR
jgi:hypothetical protein